MLPLIKGLATLLPVLWKITKAIKDVKFWPYSQGSPEVATPTKENHHLIDPGTPATGQKYMYFSSGHVSKESDLHRLLKIFSVYF